MDLLKYFFNSPEARALRTRQENEDLSQRRAIITRKEEALSAFAAVRPGLESALKTAADEVADLKAKLEEAKQRHAEAARALQVAQANLDHVFYVADRELRAAASPMIDDFEREVIAREEKVRRSFVSTDFSKRNVLGVRIPAGTTNRPAVNRALVRIREIRAEIEQLRLGAHTSAELEARFEDLRNSIPNHEIRTEYRNGVVIHTGNEISLPA